MIRNVAAISICIGSLFSGSVSANPALKIPKSTTVIKADIDGNNIPDRIVASYFIRPVLVLDDGQKNTCKTVPGIFVRYTLYPDLQKSGKVIFEENYGSTRASYWVHRLTLGKDLDRDGRKDLVFYMGDDTSDETTYLLQKPVGFKAVSVGSAGLPSYTIDSQNSLVNFNKKVAAQWNRSTEIWQSKQIGWVKGDCVAIREKPDAKSKIVTLGFDRNIMQSQDVRAVGDWIAIEDEGNNAKGWINKKYFSFSSPVRWFN
jgi:hypothetical protein